MNICKKLLALSIIFSLNAISEEISLWKDFKYEMTPLEVLDVISEMKEDTHRERGVKPTISKRIQKKEDYAITKTGYCSIYANEKIWVLGSNTFVQWCFDKPFTKKEIDNTAKLIFIKIKIHNNYADIKSKITNTFEEVYPHDWYKSLNVEKHLLNNCTSAYGVTFVNRNNDVLIAHKMVRGSTGLDPWIYFITQEDLVESLLSTCDSKIKKIQNSSDL